MKKIIIIGAGGHGKVIADIIKLCGDIVVGFLDDTKTGKFYNYDIIGATSDIGKTDCWYFAAIGDCQAREKLMKHHIKWYTAIHPSAVTAYDSFIGHGTCIMANAVINPGSKIGNGVIINTAATVDHDCAISDFVHISPGVNIAGAVAIGVRSWVGIGSTVINNINICADCTIGAGTVVVKDINEAGVYVGVPAKKMNKAGTNIGVSVEIIKNRVFRKK